MKLMHNTYKKTYIFNMKWFEILVLFTCLISNGDFHNFFTKIDYQPILGLFLSQNEDIYKVIIIFIVFINNIITGVNLYDLQSCLRIFGVI